LSPAEVSFRLLRHGLIVFLLGLTAGLTLLVFPTAFKNTRLALSSHLVGVTSGMFLICAGLLVNRIQLPAHGWKRTYWMLLYGAYGNWTGTLLGAIFGTFTLTTLTAEGHTGATWQELVVGGVLATSGTATIVACIIFYRELVREPR
jgi:hydroxylaminobenzene mutase